MYSMLLTAISNLFSKFFDWKKSAPEHQMETDIIDDKKITRKQSILQKK